MVADTIFHTMPFGAELSDAGTRFRLWAPGQKTIALSIDGSHEAWPMRQREHGWFELLVPRAVAGPGTRYRFTLENGLSVPDPASRFQPDGVHNASQVIDPLSYRWRNLGWSGRSWADTVLYELHTGTFSQSGNFAGVGERLDHLANLGVTAIELMPVAAFEGRSNWGYDGVLPFSPAAAYGRPDDLKNLVDEVHGRGLMIFLDVVYNHFGPTGNYLNAYAPSFFTNHHRTPWGDAINFDDVGNESVREFFIHNALYWLEEYCFDGLRLDAVHAIHDDSSRHILEQLASEVRRRFGQQRHVHLVLENDDNATRFLKRVDRRAVFYDAQWNDDFHHVAHAILTGEREGYYADYADAPVERLGRILAEGFAYQGEPSAFHDGQPRGEASAQLPPTAFVSFFQNHDQIGNRAFGDRLSTLANPIALRTLYALLFLAPQIPMLFMGEEWGTQRPFQFFCDFTDELAEAVRTGRRQEFARFPQFQSAETRERIPDPNLEDTFRASRLLWAETETTEGRQHLQFIRTLLDIRRDHIVPLLSQAISAPATFRVKGRALLVSWHFADASLHLAINLSDKVAEDVAWTIPGSKLYAIPADHAGTESVSRLTPWSILFSLERRGLVP